MFDKNKFNIIVAFTDKNKYISKNNEFPWPRLLGDFKFIRFLIDMNQDAVFIMGRLTYEKTKTMKFNKIVLTNTNIEGVETAKSFDEAVSLSADRPKAIFGGEKVYEEALKHNFKLFATIIKENELDGDRIFPLKTDVSKILNIKNTGINLDQNKINGFINVTDQVVDFCKLHDLHVTNQIICEKNQKYSFFISYNESIY
ncbi:hypothetical protein NUSPORA_00643 [Nucleospora cyclopteri]